MPYEDRHGRTCGFVDFEEEENSGRFFRRYFMISPQDGCFYYYMDNPNNLPDGSKPVSDIKLSHISNARDATKQRPKVEYCFVVTTPDRNYYFQADNQRDLEEWVRSLNGASRIMLKIPDKRSDVDPDRAENGGNKQDKHSTISYRTEIVGGVVVRTPVENPPSDTDSEDETAMKSRSWPRSPSPTPVPLNRPSHTLPHHGQAIKTGWCVKQGGVRRNWKRRFFVLNDKGLSYYKSETDKEALRTIVRKDITSCQESHNSQLLAQRDNLLEVGTGQRTFYVQAYSPEEMQDWIKAIQTVISSQGASSPEESDRKRSSLQQEKQPSKPDSKRDSRKSLVDKKETRQKRDSNKLRPESACKASGNDRESPRRSKWYDEDDENDKTEQQGGAKAETDGKPKSEQGIKQSECKTGTQQDDEEVRVPAINTATMVTEL